MSNRWRCGRCGQSACAAVCLLLGGTGLSKPARAQGTPVGAVGRPTPVENFAAVTIDAVFLATPMQPRLTEEVTPTDCAADMTCYRGLITVRANHRWQLQVRLDPLRLSNAAVVWSPPRAPGSRDASPPLSSNWSTIASGVQPTGGLDIALHFAVTERGPVVSNAETISASLQYRLIALP